MNIITLDQVREKMSNVNINEEEEQREYFYRTKKTSLRSLFPKLYNEDEINRITECLQDASERVNYVMYHTYQFSKLFMIYNYELFRNTPKLRNNDILYFSTIISKKGNMQRSTSINRPEEYEFNMIDDNENASFKLNALKFYQEYYDELIIYEEIDNSRIHDPLSYEADIYIKVLETFIKTNITKIYERFHQAFLRAFSHPENRATERNFKEEARYLTFNLIRMNRLEEIKVIKNSNGELLLTHLKHIVPNFIWESQEELMESETNNLLYQAKKCPQKFIPSIIYMMKYIEDLNLSTEIQELNKIIEEKNEKTEGTKIRKIHYKLMNIFPQRSFIPKYITITGTGLLDFFWQSYLKDNQDPNIFGKNLRQMKKDEKPYPFEILMDSFNNKLLQLKNYNFHNQILTDRIGCSIIFKSKHKVKNESKKTRKKYFHELDKDKLIEMQGKKIIAIDPGKIDIMTAGSKINEDYQNNQYFRFTRKQINFDMKKEKYQKMNDDEFGSFLQENGKYQEWVDLTKRQCLMTKKTVNSRRYCEYLEISNRLYKLVQPFYALIFHRKLRWKRLINRRKIEDQMVSRFLEKFADPSGPKKKKHKKKVNKDLAKENLVLALGDWSENKQMRGCEPSKTKGLRKIFARHNLNFFLIDEFKTSSRCSNCGGVLDKTPKLNDNKELVWLRRVLTCNSCGTIFNRDKNACINIFKIAHCIIHLEERPKNLRRNQEEHQDEENQL